ncbi:MAG: HAMP domain-containing protein, partial [Roseiarcus sp.]
MPRFDDLSLRLKMFLAPSLMLLALIGLAFYTLLALDGNDRQLAELSEGAFKRAALVATLDGKLNIVHAHLYQLTSVATNDSSTERKKTLADALAKEMTDADAAFAAVKDAAFADARAAPLVETLAKTMKSYDDSGQQVIGMAAFDAATASVFMGNADQAYGEAQKLIGRLTHIVQQRKNEVVDSAHEENARARMVYLAALIAVALIAISATWLASNRISRPVVVMAGAMRKLAGGDLSTETLYAGRRDEIGAIAAALQVFKETAVEATRLAAEREKQR